MKKAPCKECTERTLTCHGLCHKYKEWKAELDKTNEWLRSQRAETSVHIQKAMFGKIRRLAMGHERKNGRRYDDE